MRFPHVQTTYTVSILFFRRLFSSRRYRFSIDGIMASSQSFFSEGFFHRFNVAKTDNQKFPCLNPFFQKAFFIANKVRNKRLQSRLVSILFFRRLFSSWLTVFKKGEKIWLCLNPFFQKAFFITLLILIIIFIIKISLNPFFQKAFFIYTRK